MPNPRRAFLLGSALTALSQSRVLGANDRVRIGGIGTGGRGQYLLQLTTKLPQTEIVALCDVYEPRLSQAAEKLAPGARLHADYRELLDRKDIDAVVIGSPDHWHVRMTLDAVRAGKDVYVEKPVTHTIEEADILLRGVEGGKQIVQTGTQQRSWAHFQQARDLIANGAIGKVPLVLTYWYQDYGHRRPPVIDAAKLNWNQWLGSAPKQEFDPLKYTTWRWFWDFGGGAFTDLFTHWVDVVHWALGKDAPTATMATGGRYVLTDLECPDTVNAALDYGGATQVVYNGNMTSSNEDGGLIFRGTEAMLRLNRSGFTVHPEMALKKDNYSSEPTQIVKSEHDGTSDHIQNWLDCIKSRHVPNAPVTVGIAAARAGHLANLAYRKGARITYPLPRG